MDSYLKKTDAIYGKKVTFEGEPELTYEQKYVKSIRAEFKRRNKVSNLQIVKLGDQRTELFMKFKDKEQDEKIES